MSDSSNNVAAGWSLTSILALLLSWQLNHSAGYALVHMFLGWLYLIYAAIARGSEVNAIARGLFG